MHSRGSTVEPAILACADERQWWPHDSGSDPAGSKVCVPIISWNLDSPYFSSSGVAGRRGVEETAFSVAADALGAVAAAVPARLVMHFRLQPAASIADACLRLFMLGKH